ncbi:MAG: cytochrome ubiquinol oxidase subunit I [Candidatus Electrothrix sp. GW3-4]|uniref:cytochrome ubiquinol oxidase subunit I n=1 Tax=Candidatus Electrothrix sp. GW3-4 TaxID=3126740 RepID=UPI0030D3302C
MIENVDLSTVNWARAQFAMTALYHWIFVPLTLGMTWLIAFFHTIYIKTGSEEWKHLTKFWMRLFGINFAIGVATGIILEFEFGTNWSNYSWMVGDIFGAPLAIEGIFAFFCEATFFAVMFFGWNRVSKRFHLFSTWMVAVGSNLSAVWILVANGWMQHPVGQAFNPDSARFEMQNFADVVFNPVAVSKFTHATSSAMLYSALFVISISSWYLLKGRHEKMAKRSIMVASIFGLFASGFVAFTGDESAYEVARHQPMKLAAMEGLYQGEKGADLIGFGVLNSAKKVGDDQEPFSFVVKVPGLLSLLANRSIGSFVPGLEDLVYGNSEENIMGSKEKMVKGKMALTQLELYKKAKEAGDEAGATTALAGFERNKDYMGYGFLEKPEDAVPPVGLTFNAFHIMIALGTFFPLVFLGFLFFSLQGTLLKQRWLLAGGAVMFFFGMIAQMTGWIVAEVGRQPWAIQELLPVTVARTNLPAGSVATTFFLFLALFTVLLIAEISIMLKQISLGPEKA